MAIHDALQEVGITFSLSTKLALQGRITASERQKRQGEAMESAFKSLSEVLEAL
jgi:hypothetical protein